MCHVSIKENGVTCRRLTHKIFPNYSQDLFLFGLLILALGLCVQNRRNESFSPRSSAIRSKNSNHQFSICNKEITAPIITNTLTLTLTLTPIQRWIFNRGLTHQHRRSVPVTLRPITRGDIPKTTLHILKIPILSLPRPLPTPRQLPQQRRPRQTLIHFLHSIPFLRNNSRRMTPMHPTNRHSSRRLSTRRLISIRRAPITPRQILIPIRLTHPLLLATWARRSRQCMIISTRIPIR